MAHEDPFVTEGKSDADNEQHHPDSTSKPNLHAHDAICEKNVTIVWVEWMGRRRSAA